MTALILQATPFIEVALRKLQALGVRFSRALDDFAEARMRNAVPEWQLRKADRDFKHCQRHLGACRTKQIKRRQASRVSRSSG